MLKRKFREQLEAKHPMDESSLRKFVCYTLALGKTEWGSLSDGRWLEYVDAKTYFPNIRFEPAVNPIKKKYKIAYLILAHKTLDVVENIKKLIQALDYDDSLVLIHVDLKSWHTYESLRYYIQNLPASKQSRIKLMTNRHTIQWGLSSIVFAQLDGFFQLLDEGDWDFVVNLSASDYPLRSTDYIHRRLQVSPFLLFFDFIFLQPGHLYINYFSDKETEVDRINVSLSSLYFREI